MFLFVSAKIREQNTYHIEASINSSKEKERKCYVTSYQMFNDDKEAKFVSHNVTELNDDKGPI